PRGESPHRREQPHHHRVAHVRCAGPRRKQGRGSPASAGNRGGSPSIRGSANAARPEAGAPRRSAALAGGVWLSAATIIAFVRGQGGALAIDRPPSTTRI